ncbi:MAG: hypothetical protein M3P96_16375, partial [Actinomycetota bacterium]|nr:hypothetical protein [Actinomycetota bacterium]
LLARAARAGATAAPATALVAALTALGVGHPEEALRAAVAAGGIVADPDPALLAAAALAAAEDDVAENVERLLVTADDPGGAVVVVTGCCPEARLPALHELLAAGSAAPAVVADAGGGAAARLAAALLLPVAAAAELARGDAGVVVVAEAQRVDAPGFASVLEAIPDGARLVVEGDVAARPGRGAGDVFADLVSSGVLPVTEHLCPVPAEVATPRDLAHAVRAGDLPPLRSPDHTLVALAVEDDPQCVARAEQLVRVSVPRAFSLTTPDIAVLTPLRRGPAGADALAVALPGSPVLTVDEAADRLFPAAVVVLPAGAAGVLSRPLVHAALRTATRHLSVVHATGPGLAAAVAAVGRHRRTTRLPGLLRAGRLGG